MSWTKVNKPTGSDYTRVTAGGKVEYDSSEVLFDDSNVFWDGINYAAWTDVAKPTGTAYQVAGMSMGMLIPLTATRTGIIGNPWVKVSKPT